MRKKGFPVVVTLLACLALGCFAGRKQITGDETSPEPAYWVAPDYSEFARLAGLQGKVVLKLLVAPDGSVLDIQLSKELHPNLDQAAVEAARQWRFLPARRRYRPAERPAENTWVAVPFEFILPRVRRQWPPVGKVKLPWSEELLEPGATFP
ncbi:energy transducer TonB [candidate division TA06 bacterium]|uniref:Energy transducer TonB n=1 Tax=candidate division TA06 bacterium TaxID=2250710 RepID=A0A523UYJ7_UNCT6|nr:MAG: energy transducer TonB [candidate division TA06 bacterium]